MSIAAVGWALKVAKVKDPIAKLVLIALADHARDDGTSTWPFQSTIAEYAEVSGRTVRTKLGYLEDHGFIRRGNQRLVSHLKPWHRPVVWDLGYAIAPIQPAADEAASQPTDRKDLPGVPDADADQQGGEDTDPRKDFPGVPESGGLSTPPEGFSGDPGSTLPYPPEARFRTPRKQLLPTEPSLKPSMKGEGSAPAAPASAGSPQDPQTELGGRRPTDDDPYRARADRCVKHQYDRHPPPCGRCREAREAHAEDVRATARAKAVAERERAEDEARTRWAAITNCDLCDNRGYTATGQICNHDPDAPERTSRGINRARKSITRKDQP